MFKKKNSVWLSCTIAIRLSNKDIMINCIKRFLKVNKYSTTKAFFV